MAEKKSFEATMKELEQVIGQLEQGNLELDQALAAFEKGIKLSKTCQRLLTQAEQKVSRLVAEADGSVTEEDFA